MSEKVNATLQAAWRKAYQDGEFTITVKKASTRHKMRFMLYMEAKRIKKMRAGFDPELEAAVIECMVSTQGCKDNELKIVHRSLDEDIQNLAGQLHIDIEVVKESSPLANDAQESLKRLMDMGIIPKEGKDGTSKPEAAKPELPPEVQEKLKNFRRDRE